MPFDVHMKLVNPPKGLAKAWDITRRAAYTTINAVLVVVRAGMVTATPTVTGTTRTSWQTDRARARKPVVSGRVFSSQVSALVLDRGAKRHFPPVGVEPALGVWIRRKLGIRDPKKIRATAFLIGRAIRRRGLKKRLIFTKKFARMQPRIAAMFRLMQKKIAERILRAT